MTLADEELSPAYIRVIEDKIFQLIERFSALGKEIPNLRSFQRYIKLIPPRHIQTVLDNLVCEDYLVEHKNSKTVRYSQVKARESVVCEICGNVEETRPGTSLCVDHDHVTGKIRGLVCLRCNWALLAFEAFQTVEECQDFAKKVSEYLVRHR